MGQLPWGKKTFKYLSLSSHQQQNSDFTTSSGWEQTFWSYSLCPSSSNLTWLMLLPYLISYEKIGEQTTISQKVHRLMDARDKQPQCQDLKEAVKH